MLHFFSQHLFPSRLRTPVAVVVGMMFLSSCRQDMHDQPRFEAFEQNEFYPDGRSMRARVEGTIARGELELDELLYEGKEAGKIAELFPFQMTAADIERGRQRYDIYCSICHDHAGQGSGAAVERGMRAPSSFHDERLRTAAPGHYFDAITNGFGVMIDYSDRIDARDRWRIVAYIRALQLSQYAPIEEVPADIRRRLEEVR